MIRLIMLSFGNIYTEDWALKILIYPSSYKVTVDPYAQD